MSAPDTNLDKQQKQHRAPLWGMWSGLGIVAILFLGWLFWTVGQGEELVTPAQQVDGRTGELVPANPDASAERPAATGEAVSD